MDLPKSLFHLATRLIFKSFARWERGKASKRQSVWLDWMLNHFLLCRSNRNSSENILTVLWFANLLWAILINIFLAFHIFPSSLILSVGSRRIFSRGTQKPFESSIMISNSFLTRNEILPHYFVLLLLFKNKKAQQLRWIPEYKIEVVVSASSPVCHTRRTMA